MITFWDDSNIDLKILSIFDVSLELSYWTYVIGWNLFIHQMFWWRWINELTTISLDGRKWSQVRLESGDVLRNFEFRWKWGRILIEVHRNMIRISDPDLYDNDTTNRFHVTFQASASVSSVWGNIFFMQHWFEDTSKQYVFFRYWSVIRIPQCWTRERSADIHLWSTSLCCSRRWHRHGRQSLQYHTATYAQNYRSFSRDLELDNNSEELPKAVWYNFAVRVMRQTSVHFENDILLVSPSGGEQIHHLWHDISLEETSK